VAATGRIAAVVAAVEVGRIAEVVEECSGKQVVVVVAVAEDELEEDQFVHLGHHLWRIPQVQFVLLSAVKLALAVVVEEQIAVVVAQTVAVAEEQTVVVAEEQTV